VPSGFLSLCRFIADAWHGGLRAWCEEARGFEGESWLLVENAGQERWLRSEFAAAAIERVQIFDAEALRDEFARRAGMAALPPNGAAAAFAVKVALAQEPEAAGAPGGRNATTLAEACDALSRAGWHWNQLGIEGAAARRIGRIMDRAGVIAGILDRRLREALPAQPARLCCVGWDAVRWPDMALLELAAAKARTVEIYAPLPRLPGDGQQGEWIEEVEKRLGLERRTCAESGFVTENEALVARLEKSDTAPSADARTPALLVGREWPDQVALVCEKVLEWLGEGDAPSGPIGVIGPDDSPTAVAVAEELKRKGVPVEHPARRPEPVPELLILEQVARYHLSGQDIEELIELARILWLHGGGGWTALKPEETRDALDRAFQVAQSRNARIAAQALPRRKDATWTAVTKLAAVLGRWDGVQSWPALRIQWETMLDGLGLDASPLGWAWTRLNTMFREEQVPGKALMEWLAEHIAAHRREASPPDYGMQARVVVTSFADAAQQPWGRVIFFDSNEHVWPASRGENPFLPDAAMARLNLRRGESGRMLATRDLRAIEEGRFLDLIEQTRGVVAFAGVLREQMETGDHAQPNEWVLRALIETARDGGGPALDQWAAAARACDRAVAPALDTAEREHMERVHASRRSPLMPFDSYQFNFGGSKIECEAWSATDLDAAAVTPATFALNTLFGAESTVGKTFSRGEAAAVGNRAHRWLGHILGGGEGLAAPPPERDDDAKLEREMEMARRELEEWYAAEGMTVPIWWLTCLRKTRWAARRCLREAREWLDGQLCATEQTLAVRVQTPAGTLPLKGRVDLLISDQPQITGARVRIFDFKTGRTAVPTLGTLGNGKGAQFGAYYLMARDAGAAEAVVGIIKPETRAQDVFGGEAEVELRARFGVLVELAQTLRFGRLGPLVSEYGVRETLPMATTPIDPAVLKQKAGLFLLAQ